MRIFDDNNIILLYTAAIQRLYHIILILFSVETAREDDSVCTYYYHIVYRLICNTTDETITIKLYYITCDRGGHHRLRIGPVRIYYTYAYIVSIDSVSDRRHCHGRRRAGTIF